MSVLNVLRGVVGNDGFTLTECRNCGEKLAEDATECPACDASEIAVYEF